MINLNDQYKQILHDVKRYRNRLTVQLTSTGIESNRMNRL